MGATKQQTYTQKQIEYAKFFKALGHPARIAALENLMKSTGYEAGFDELFDNIDLTQSTKSEHLKKLTEIGILRTKLTYDGRRSCLRYRVHKEAIELMNNFLNFIYEDVNWNFNNYQTNEFYSAFHPAIDWPMVCRT